MKEKRWILASHDPKLAREMAEQTGFSPLVCAVLCARGITDAAAAVRALATDVESIEDGFVLRDMEKAVGLIRSAIDAGKRMAVYGDYDCDGVTSTTILTHYLRSQGADCRYYIPDRISEGYGMHSEGLEQLAADGVQLLITVDNGITALEEVAEAHRLGMQVIVTDHHQCLETLPEADAIVNPQNPAEHPRFRTLAGVGVACKLIAALMGKDGKSDIFGALQKYGELVALGTVADLMPIREENRAIVNLGVRRISITQNVGLRALCRAAGLLGAEQKPITTDTLGFILGPRVNAAGRMGAADRAVELFLTEDEAEAERIVGELIDCNKSRQGEEGRIFQEAVALWEQQPGWETDPVLVLWHEGWHHGVIGIVASRLSERYHRPVMLLSIDEGIAKGSGRGIRGFNVFEAICSVSDCLIQYGGHAQAGGVTLRAEHLEHFREGMLAYAAAHPVDDTPCLEIDCGLSPELLTLQAVDGLRALEPYGLENQKPLFCMENLRVTALQAIGNGKHLKFSLEKDGSVLDGVFFGQTPDSVGLSVGDRVDAAFHAEVNEFRGRRVQLMTKDLRWTAAEREADAADQALLDRYLGNESLTAAEKQQLLPDRQTCVAVWKHLCGICKEDAPTELDPRVLYRRMRGSADRLTYGRMQIALLAFRELGLLQLGIREDRILCRPMPNPQRVDLAKAAILQGLCT